MIMMGESIRQIWVKVTHHRHVCTSEHVCTCMYRHVCMQRHVCILCMYLRAVQASFKNKAYKVNESNDQEMAQLKRKSHYKTEPMLVKP